MNKFPDVLKKREILYGSKPQAESKTLSIADSCFEEERYSEALDYYIKIADQNGVIKTFEKAVEVGNAHIFLKCYNFGVEHNVEILIDEQHVKAQQCLQQAEKRGLSLYISQLHQLMGNEEKAAELREQLISSKMIWEEDDENEEEEV